MSQSKNNQQIVRARGEQQRKIISDGAPRIIAEGRIGAIVDFPVLVDKGQGYERQVFEKFMRPPGTRTIAVRNSKIFLQREARLETAGFDWRLPGGKVFDSFAEFKPFLDKDIPIELIIAAARKELAEEAKISAVEVKLLAKKICGATVGWDLYYLVADGIKEIENAAEHNEGEEVKSSGWFTFAEARGMCERGEIGEGRTVAALVEFIANAQ